MEEITKVHVGLDVHKDSISVGVAEPGRGAGRVIGKVVHDLGKLNCTWSTRPALQATDCNEPWSRRGTAAR